MDNRPRGGREIGLLRNFPRLLYFLTRFPPLQLQHLQIGTCEELQCCRSIENTPKDLTCLQSAIAAEQCSAAIAEPCLQLQEAPLQL